MNIIILPVWIIERGCTVLDFFKCFTSQLLKTTTYSVNFICVQTSHTKIENTHKIKIKACKKVFAYS